MIVISWFVKWLLKSLIYRMIQTFELSAVNTSSTKLLNNVVTAVTINLNTVNRTKLSDLVEKCLLHPQTRKTFYILISLDMGSHDRPSRASDGLSVGCNSWLIRISRSKVPSSHFTRAFSTFSGFSIKNIILNGWKPNFFTRNFFNLSSHH